MTTGGPPVERLQIEPPRRRGVVLVVVVALVLLGGFALLTRTPEPTSLPTPTPSPTPARTPTPVERSPEPSATTSPTGDGPRVVRRGTGPLVEGLGGTLYARSADTLYRIDLGRGTVVATSGTGVDSGGPVDLVATSDGVVLRPLDSVPGWLVRDGRTPVPLQRLLSQSSVAYPAPCGRLWVDRAGSGFGALQMTQADENGRAVGRPLATPGDYRPDLAGGLLLYDVGGVWQVDGTALRRVTTGTVTAVGVHQLRAVECDAGHRCHAVLVNRRDGSRRTLGSAVSNQVGYGSISPDGRYVAESSPDGNVNLTVRRLSDGRALRTFTGAAGYGIEPPGIWLPGGWLALVSDGRLVLYRPDAGAVHPQLPVRDLTDLAYRR